MGDYYVRELILDYERDILGRRYTIILDNGDSLTFSIEKGNVPHLLGVRKLPIRQVQNKSADAIYEMLKNGIITANHIGVDKEAYKKTMNFERLTSLLHCGDMVKIVKRRGTLNSSYLLYLDNRPKEILHLGLAHDTANGWYPESFLVLKDRDVTAYIKDQQQVGIIDILVA